MKRPITITIASILVFVMMLLSAVWPLVGGNQLLGLKTGAVDQEDRLPLGGQIPQGTPPASGNLSQNDQGQDPQNQGAFSGIGMRPPQPGTELFADPSGSTRWPQILQYVLYILVIVLGLIATGGLWMWKRWGSEMAMITAAVVLIMAILSILNMAPTMGLFENILKIVLAIAVIVMACLPKSRPVQTADA